MDITTSLPLPRPRTDAREAVTTPATEAGSLLVALDAKPDFSAIERMPRGAARKSAAWKAIVANAAASQTAAVELAKRLVASGALKGYEALSAPNMVVVTPAKGADVMAIGRQFHALDGVRMIYENHAGSYWWGPNQSAPIAGPVSNRPATYGGLDVMGPATHVTTAMPEARPYGVDLIAAPAAWEQGADGTGMVYGSIDTGVDASHPAIAAKFRGRRADGSVSYDYNWYDASGRSTTARDFDQHGTHTIGTVVGDEIGVAPNAKFISAAGIDSGPGGALKAIQWMLAPTRTDGTAADPTKAPDVVGMSWWTGPSNQDFFLESMRDLRAAGIEPVKSAGNQGPKGGSITSPGQFGEVTATAAVDANGKVASFSSRGPGSFPDGVGTPKPDFAAPGVSVTSALPGGRYGTMSGTSMAQPHMSGAILDILSKYPRLTHDQLHAALKAGATDAGAPGFDPEYGNGTINIQRALAAAARLTAH
jgi:subtilisin family serine protease